MIKAAEPPRYLVPLHSVSIWNVFFFFHPVLFLSLLSASCGLSYHDESTCHRGYQDLW